MNDGATNEFKVERGLRHGGPVSSFLFVLVMEGLTRLLKKALKFGKFKGFYVNEEVGDDIIQFADDTVILGEGSWNNFWCIKYLLWGFEMVSGLKINFCKSHFFN